MELAQRVTVPYELLPYHSEFLAYLKAQHAMQRKLILATASDRRFALGIASYLGIFSDVLGTTSERNLSGPEKAKVLLAQFGEKGFDYAGNANPDLVVWTHARRAIVVNPLRGVLEKARNIAEVDRVFTNQTPKLKTFVRAIRAYQWVKNLLIFIPLLVAHEWMNTNAIFSSAVAFIAFSLCASAIYLINDTLDLDSDRAHPRKKNRPIANGNLSILSALVWSVCLLIFGVVAAYFVSLDFTFALCVYILTTSAYSFWLKPYILVDVILLAFLYTLRVIAGAVAIQVAPSFWLLAFSMLMFTSLALIKRCAELESLKHQQKKSANGRDYLVSDLQQLTSLGTAAGYGAIVIFALYINSPDVAIHYHHPKLLWLLCPLLLYWIGRMWIKTGRGEMHDDPIVYAAKDRTSLLAVFCAVLMILLAI
jgi:4-hydroxybenzoate polyprenyltransferase